MSERAPWKDLVDAIDEAAGTHDYDYVGDGHDIASTICEHLEITWGDVEGLRNKCSSTMFNAPSWCGCFECSQARKFATLLEAAGVKR